MGCLGSLKKENKKKKYFGLSWVIEKSQTKKNIYLGPRGSLKKDNLEKKSFGLSWVIEKTQKEKSNFLGCVGSLKQDKTKNYIIWVVLGH